MREDSGVGTGWCAVPAAPQAQILHMLWAAQNQGGIYRTAPLILLPCQEKSGLSAGLTSLLDWGWQEWHTCKLHTELKKIDDEEENTENFLVPQLQLSKIKFSQAKKFFKKILPIYTALFKFYCLKIVRAIRSEMLSWEIQTKIYWDLQRS